MIVTCCKCFRNTRMFNCPKCGHKVCTSCKEVKRKPRGFGLMTSKRTPQSVKVRIDHDERRRQNDEVHEIIKRYIKERM